jgi:four helix bundle protein
MQDAHPARVPSNSLEDLQVFQKSVAAADAISALTNRPEFRRDPELRDQLRSSSARVPALISEGHGQKTDRHFASYLFNARGSSKEVRAHLRVARGRGFISENEEATYAAPYHEIPKMLTGLIKHLEREDRKIRF